MASIPLAPRTRRGSKTARGAMPQKLPAVRLTTASWPPPRADERMAPPPPAPPAIEPEHHGHDPPPRRAAEFEQHDGPGAVDEHSILLALVVVTLIEPPLHMIRQCQPCGPRKARLGRYWNVSRPTRREDARIHRADQR